MGHAGGNLQTRGGIDGVGATAAARPASRHGPDIWHALQTTTRWYPLEPTDASFLDSAPHVFRYRKRYAAPPERVWESLASDASISDGVRRSRK